jgi:hypothetical protein
MCTILWGRQPFVHDVTFICCRSFYCFVYVAQESSLSDTRCLIQYVVSPHCGDKRMAQSCTRSSLPNYFGISLKCGVQHVNVSNVNKAIEWTATKLRISMICQNSSAAKISCNFAPFFYHHSVVIQHIVSDTLYQTSYFLYIQRKVYKMLDTHFLILFWPLLFA